MTESEESRRTTSGLAVGRRLVLASAATAGAVTAGVALAEPARASSWIAPSVKAVFGAPAAATSGAGFLVELTFNGSRTAFGANGVTAQIPAELIVANVATVDSIPSETRIMLTASTAGFPTIDLNASAAGATLNGVAAGAGALAVDSQTFLLQSDIAPGSLLRIPVVASLADSATSTSTGTINAGYTTFVGTDATATADRVAVADVIAGPTAATGRLKLEMQGERLSLRAEDGKYYRYPASLVIRNASGAEPGTVRPIPEGTFIRAFAEEEWSPGQWDGFYNGGLTITSSAPMLNGIPAPSAGYWEKKDRAATDSGFWLTAPLNQGDVLEFPLHTTRPERNSSWTVAARYWATSGGVEAAAPITQLATAPTAPAFDASVAFVGDVRVQNYRNVPASVQLSVLSGTASAGTIVSVVGDSGYGLSVSEVGPLAVNGVVDPSVGYVSRTNDFPALTQLIVLTADLPSGSVLSAPLTWELAPLARGGKTLTATLIADGDSMPANNTATRTTTF